jgi:hypothetical protein
MRPAGHHFTNVILHAANTLLLFLVFSRMTGALWRSALLAALFAVHPLHVESVAWVAERKDVLSTFFGLLAIWAYIKYARDSSRGQYLLMLCLFGLSLMAKQMLVSLPCILLLLDIWPLGRWKLGALTISNRYFETEGDYSSLTEKVPLVACPRSSASLRLFRRGAAKCHVRRTASAFKARGQRDCWIPFLSG